MSTQLTVSTLCSSFFYSQTFEKAHKESGGTYGVIVPSAFVEVQLSAEQ